METKFVTPVFDRKKRVKDGKSLVELRIYVNRLCKKYISDRWVTKRQWRTYSQSKELQNRVEHYNSIINAMIMLNEPITSDNLNVRLGIDVRQKVPVTKEQEEEYRKRQSFIDFFRDELTSEKIGDGTRKTREVVLNSVIEFGGLRSFGDITPKNIMAYNKYLQDPGTRSIVTIRGYHKRLHHYVKKAYELGYIERDPYNTVTIPKGRSAERMPLTESELNTLRDLEVRGKLQSARDLFIFSAYTGLAYSDAQKFDFSRMTEKHGETYYIDGKRVKTGSNFFTPILPPAMEVLESYNYRLPHMSNQKLNDYLHLLQEKAKINKPITSHLARHTFATLVLSKDVPIANLARMLGHRDIKTTLIYAKILKSTIQRQSEKLVEMFK